MCSCRVWLSRWRPDTLTAMPTWASSGVSRQAAIWRVASSSTHRSRSMIRLLVSAIGMNEFGGWMPWPGRSQRTSASTPDSRPVSRSITGW